MLNELLRLLRVLNDLKSIELAEKLGISPSYLSEIEAGKKQPTLDLIQRFAEVFHTTPGTLLSFAENLAKEPKRKDYKTLLRKKAIELLQLIESGAPQNLPHKS